MSEEHRRAWNTLEPHVRAQLRLRLTDRQFFVFALRYVGCSWKDISEALALQPRTVRTHYEAAKIVYQQIRQEAA